MTANPKVFACLLSALMTIMQSNAESLSKYTDWMHNVQQEVWNTDAPAFHNYTVPESLRNESAVILALYNRIESKKSEKINKNALAGIALGVAFGALGAGIGASAGIHIPLDMTDADITTVDMTRMLVAINDSTALNRFKNLDLNEVNFTGSSRIPVNEPDLAQDLAAGIRIIKRNGDIREIALDSMLNEYGDAGKKPVTVFETRPINIPELKIGDCVDVFFLMKRGALNQGPRSFYILAKTEYPILSHSGDIKIDKNLSMQYRTLNGMPEPTDSIGKDKSHNLHYDVPFSQRSDNRLSLKYLDTPILLVDLFNPKNVLTPEYARKKGIHANPSPENVRDEAWRQLDIRCTNAKSGIKYLFGAYQGNPVKEAKNNLKSKKWNNRQAADFLFDATILAYSLNELEPAEHQFLAEFGDVLRQCNIEFKYALTAKSTSPGWDNILTPGQYNLMLVLKESGAIYTLPSYIAPAGELSSMYFRGATGEIEAFPADKSTHREKSKMSFAIPDSALTETSVTNHILAEPYGNLVKLTRTSNFHGYSKYGIQPIIYQGDYEKAMLEHLNKDVNSPLSIKYPDVLSHEEEENLKFTKSAIKKIEIDLFHGTYEMPELYRYNIDSYGFTKENPDIIINAEYVLADILHNAEDTLILDIGKLCHQPMDTITEKEEHVTPISIFAETNVDHLIVRPQEGYVFDLEQLPGLSYSVKNDIGEFSVACELCEEGLKVTKSLIFYENIMAPAAKWQQILDIDNAYNRWYNQSVRLVPTRPILYQ